MISMYSNCNRLSSSRHELVRFSSWEGYIINITLKLRKVRTYLFILQKAFSKLSK